MLTRPSFRVASPPPSRFGHQHHPLSACHVPRLGSRTWSYKSRFRSQCGRAVSLGKLLDLSGPVLCVEQRTGSAHLVGCGTGLSVLHKAGPGAGPALSPAAARVSACADVLFFPPCEVGSCWPDADSPGCPCRGAWPRVGAEQLLVEAGVGDTPGRQRLACSPWGVRAALHGTFPPPTVSPVASAWRQVIRSAGGHAQQARLLPASPPEWVLPSHGEALCPQG